jgi:hypothetical protein
MKSLIGIVVIVVAALFSVSVNARSGAPIKNFENVAVVTGSGMPATVEQVKKAIIAAQAAHGWVIAPAGDGKLVANINVRSKHMATLDISYSADRYSLTYLTSVNLNYEKQNGEQLIHPNYNKWVATLVNDIRVELLKIQ